MTVEPEVNQGGRPRRFDPRTERQLLLAAGRKLLGTRPYNEVTVASILQSSGLASRSFYRHFQSKDELLVHIYRENGDQLARIVAGRVARADAPVAGLAAWVDELLRLRFDPRTARYLSIWDDPSAMQVVTRAGATGSALDALLRPLIEVLEAGLSDGSFPLAEPVADAWSAWAVVRDVVSAPPGRPSMTREEAQSYVVRFVAQGLGHTAS